MSHPARGARIETMKWEDYLEQEKAKSEENRIGIEEALKRAEVWAEEWERKLEEGVRIWQQ